MSSAAAFQGEPARPAYATAKAGIGALTRHVASRWGKEGIRCNAVAPGFTATEAIQSAPQWPELQTAALKRIRGPRVGAPDDIAALVAFLISAGGRVDQRSGDQHRRRHRPAMTDTDKAVSTSTPRKRDGDERRRELCDAAIKVLAEHGSRGLTHGQVDRYAGVPDGTTSYYYRTRAALLRGVGKRVADIDVANLRSVSDEPLDPLGRRSLIWRDSSSCSRRSKAWRSTGHGTNCC